MEPFRQRRIANTDFHVTQLGFGGGTLGDPDEVTENAQSQATLATAFEAGVGYFDTAPWYGNTKSEHRVGQFLRVRPRDRYTLGTKVGRVYFRPDEPAAFSSSQWAKRWRGGLSFDLRFDYTSAGISRSYEDSLQRLGINTVDALTIHDLDFKHQKNEEGVRRGFEQLDAGGGFATLKALKERGEIQAIGAGVNHVGMIPRFLEHFDIDYFLVAMPYTLLDQSALDSELPLCQERGVSIIVGAVFASGILATGATTGSVYGYLPADGPTMDRVRRMEAVCQRHGVPLAAAALQFPLAHSQVVSVIPGANSAQQVLQNLSNAQQPIPVELWAELKQEGLLRPDVPTPG
ncbi:MAG: aldo/keto reductase [Gammaproteobacteria bacterium]|nr:aldo/keto reductase [Gammaproteobacteria bacterium]MDX2461776.1 aldo/keto reductase [Gammaproteobacteria bacterium]